MLLVLNRSTWTRGEESKALAAEVHEAKRLGVHVLLAHEIKGARVDDEERGGCSFDEIINTTPEQLISAGVYNEIAMNLGGGEWREAGLLGIALEIAGARRITHRKFSLRDKLHSIGAASPQRHSLGVMMRTARREMPEEAKGAANRVTNLLGAWFGKGGAAPQPAASELGDIQGGGVAKWAGAQLLTFRCIRECPLPFSDSV